MAQFKVAQYKNEEVKGKVTDSLDTAVFDAGKLSQAITKSSKTREILHQCTKTFVGLESTISNTEQSLKMMDKTLAKLQQQTDVIQGSLKNVERIRSGIDAMWTS